MLEISFFLKIAFSFVPSREACWNYQIGFSFIFYSVFIGLTLYFLVCVLSCTHRHTVYGCPHMPKGGRMPWTGV